MQNVNAVRKRRSGVSRLVIALTAIGGLAILVFLSFKGYRMLNPYLDRELSGPVTVTSAWLELTPREPLRAERQVQYLYLHTVDPFVPDHSVWGIRFPDGSVVVPEVQLVDQYGNIHAPRASSFSLADRRRPDVISGIGFRVQDLPPERVFEKVRIKSARPINLSSIVWRNYNQWDRK